MAKRRKKVSTAKKKEWAWGYLFVLPNLIGFCVFFVLPVIYGIIVSLTNYNGFKKFDFIGIQNYINLFKDKFFVIALKNNIYYSLVFVPLTIFLALILALALNRPKKLNGLFKTVFYFPSITSIVAIGIVWAMIMNPGTGPLNMMLRAIGISDPPKWIASSDTAMISIIIIMAWKNAGYYMIMFLGGLKTIPNHLYEAAKIDGANGWQLFRFITWPMLSATTFMVFILIFISSFQVFDAINIMTEGGPGKATTVIVYRIFTEGFESLKFGYASAMAYFLFFIILIITLIQFWGQNKWVYYD
ncbi:MAG: sugar ABC transporter permease [Lachnospiraceae bacterium]|nr:sugar ABC transporter permease [Lachnospiraceae bacterium]